MQFTPENCDKILRGEKTQTRRVVKEGDKAELWVGRVLHNGRLKWELDGDYAVQPGRGKHSVARIKLLDIRREPVQHITADDARAEGITLDISDGDYSKLLLDTWALEAFESLWDSINTAKGKRWADNPAVWVLQFELVKDN